VLEGLLLQQVRSIKLSLNYNQEIKVPKQSFLLEDYQALGTKWYIELFGIESFNNLNDIKIKIIDEIEEFQRRYSRFLPDSLLNNLNSNKSVDFDHDLWEMLSVGERYREDTGGIFDLFVKGKLESVGYGSQSLVDNKKIEIKKYKPRVFVEEEKIFLNTNEQVDLGGIGKGYLIDKLATLLRSFGFDYFVINGGGDIYVSSDIGKPVELYLQHPIDPDLAIGKLALKDSSLCVSSSFKRTWEQGGVERNHFVDTKKNRLVVAASYVVAKSALSADVAATVLCLLANNQNRIQKIAVDMKLEYLVINESGNTQHSGLFEKAIKEL
jgi:FAD:protein FMN transferase